MKTLRELYGEILAGDELKKAFEEAYAAGKVPEFLKEHGIRTRIRRKLSEGSDEILQSIRAGYVSYVINTRAIKSGVHYEDGVAIRQCATENNITMFTSLDTVRVLHDVLEELTICVSTINEK